MINMIGVRTMARINNFGVATELVGVCLLIILLTIHITRGPAIVFDTFDIGVSHTFGYFGAFLVAGLMSAYGTPGRSAPRRRHSPLSTMARTEATTGTPLWTDRDPGGRDEGKLP